MSHEYKIVTGGTHALLDHMLYIHTFYTISYFTMQPDNGLDIAKTCSCLFVNNQTNISYPQRNLLSLFKCEKYNRGE
jgi:hypothetical protein